MKPNQIVEQIRSVSERLYDIKGAGKDLGRVASSDLISLGAALKEWAQDFEYSAHLSIEAGGNNETKRVSFIAPAKCVLTSIKIVKPFTVVGDPLLTVNNRDAIADTDKNVLGATNYDLSGLATVNEAESLALSSTAANLELAEGDVVTLSVVCDADDSHAGFGTLLSYKLQA